MSIKTKLPFDDCHFGYHKIDPKTQHNCKTYPLLPKKKRDFFVFLKEEINFGRLQLPKMRKEKN
jgi:hypothetical protein